MDPRPYNYQFRRPRVNNPTYQSYNAYDSLYHMGRMQYLNGLNDYSRASNYYPRNYDNYYQQYVQESAPKASREASKRYEEIGVNTDQKSNRSSSNYSQRSRSSSASNNPNIHADPNPTTHRASVLSTYGSNSLERKEGDSVPSKQISANIVFAHNDTSQIFKKQQRPFDIINMYARQNEPLRKYPKFTREHLLYEQGLDVVHNQ